MRYLLAMWLIIMVTHCFSQEYNNISGKYAKPETIYPQLDEAIILGDSTFEYTRKGAFTKFDVKGYWRIQDGYLILSSFDSAEKGLEVREGFRKNIDVDSIKLKITYFDHTVPYCTIVTNEGDQETEVKYSNVYGEILLPKKQVKSITIYSVIKHTTYLVRNCSSNYLEIQLSSKRIFNKEKWLLMEGQIVPIGLDGKYTSYALVRAATMQ